MCTCFRPSLFRLLPYPAWGGNASLTRPPVVGPYHRTASLRPTQGMVLVNLYACLLLLLAHYQQLSGKTSWMSSVSWQDVAAADGTVRWYNAVYYTITVVSVRQQ